MLDAVDCVDIIYLERTPLDNDMLKCRILERITPDLTVPLTQDIDLSKELFVEIFILF